MPVLVYKGDTIDNFGRYLPTPYIERVSIGDDGLYKVSMSLFIKLEDGEKIDDVLAHISDQLNIYLLFVANKETAIASGTDDWKPRTSIDDDHDHEYSLNDALSGFTKYADGHRHFVGDGKVRESKSAYGSNHTHTLQFNESIERVLSGELNIFDYYRSVSATNNSATNSFAIMSAAGTSFWTSGLEEDEAVEDFYDERGDRIIKFTVNLSASGYGVPWDTVDDFTILSFSSTYSYFDDPEGLDAELESKAFFNKQTSDIAYEKIFEGGKLTNQLQVEFFDSNDTIYNGVPLQSIDGVYYKADTIRHDTIVNYFNDLLFGVSPEPSKPYSKLQKMKDGIAYILNTVGDKPNLIRRLNALRKVFPDKSGATPVGRFYFRFNKRIMSVNRDIKTNPQLSRKVIRNPKFVDERSVPPRMPAPVTWDDAPGAGYLYSEGLVGRTAMYSLAAGHLETQTTETVSAGGEGAWEIDANTLTEVAWTEGTSFDAIVRNAGFFFFDYEKALRNVADVNQVINIEKLIDNYGLKVDYKRFRVAEVRMRRYWGPTTNQQYVDISSELADVSYPITIATEVSERGLDSLNLVIPSPGFFSNYNPSGEEAKLVITKPEHTSLMIRNFEPMQTNEISSKIPNYRLMCFEFQDFMDDDLAELMVEGSEEYAGGSVTYEYETELVIVDSSIKFLKEFRNKYENSMNDLVNYIALADKDFSYDESTGLFNEFFIEGMEAMYSTNIARSPWYRAPVLYNLHRDLLFDVFGGSLSKIFEDAQGIMNNINPFNGSYYALVEFNENMKQFFDDNYSNAEGTVGHQIAEFGDTQREKTFRGVLSWESAGNTLEPYGVTYVADSDHYGGSGDPTPGPIDIDPPTGPFGPEGPIDGGGGGTDGGDDDPNPPTIFLGDPLTADPDDRRNVFDDTGSWMTQYKQIVYEIEEGTEPDYNL